MKKILVTLALAAMTTMGFAQSFGVKVGANINDLSSFDTDHKTADLGMYVGAVIDLGLPVANLGLRLEPAFSMQGASRKADVPLVGMTTWKYSYDYINVPILVEYKLLGGNLALMAGPQLGYCIGGETKTSTSDNVNKAKHDPDNYTAFDAGVTIGATYMVTPNVGIDLRYNLGFTNVGTDADNVMSNRVLSIGACYMF